MVMQVLAVAIGGAIGAVIRYAIAVFWLSRAAFPLGTLTANLLGCLIIGVLMCLSMRRDWLDESVRLLLITGLLGSLTTFSTFGFETFELAQQGKWHWAVANILANLLFGIAGVALGWAVTARVIGQA